MRDSFAETMDHALLEIDFLQYQIDESLRRQKETEVRWARRLLIHTWLRGVRRRNETACT